MGKRERIKVYSTLGASSHSTGDREINDYYATNPKAINKLLEKEEPHKNIWECACGEGHLSKRLVKKGFNVLSSDLIDRDYGYILDFLKLNKKSYNNLKQKDEFTMLNNNFDIITNPPYKYAKQFVYQALNVINKNQKVYFFLKLLFLESQNRYILFKKYPPKNIYVFSKRMGCRKNGEKIKGEGAVCFAWFVWQKGIRRKPRIRWII